MHLYKLSPSKLAWLYKDCPRCFWLDMNGIRKRPQAPFPRIFGRIDKLQRKALHSHVLPEGCTLDTSTRSVTSAPFANNNGEHNITVNGKMDCLMLYPEDGLVGVLDFKTSTPSEESIERYRRQLSAYAWALENPIKDKPLRVSGLRLLWGNPETYQLNPELDRFIMGGAVVWQDMPYDPAWFGGLLLEVMGFLAAPEPDIEIAARTCSYCNWEAMMRAEIKNPIHVNRIMP